MAVHAGLIKFFEKYPQFIPKNVILELHVYDGEQTENDLDTPQHTLRGTGKIDPFYKNSMNEFTAKVNSLDCRMLYLKSLPSDRIYNLFLKLISDEIKRLQSIAPHQQGLIENFQELCEHAKDIKTDAFDRAVELLQLGVEVAAHTQSCITTTGIRVETEDIASLKQTQQKLDDYALKTFKHRTGKILRGLGGILGFFVTMYQLLRYGETRIFGRTKSQRYTHNLTAAATDAIEQIHRDWIPALA